MLGCRVQRSRFRSYDSELRDQGLGLGVQGSGFSVECSGLGG